MKERRAVRFLFGGIFLRIAIMFLGVLVFSSAIVLFFMNSVFQKKTFEETLRSQSYSVLQLQNGLDAYLESIDQLTLGLVYNGSVQSMLQGKIPDPYTMIALLDASARRENLYILLADGYGRVYTSSNVMVPIKSTEPLMRTSLYADMQESYASLQWELCPSTLLTAQSAFHEEWMLTAGRQARHLDQSVPAGCVVVQIFPSALTAKMQDPLMRSDARYLLLDARGRVVYDSLSQFTVGDALNAPTLMRRAANGEKIYFGEAELGSQLYVFGRTRSAGLTLISCLPDASVYSAPMELFPMLLRATALGTVVALALALFFSMYFSRSIMELVLAMRQVRGGDFSVRIRPRHRDELGELAYTFNAMTRDMDALMEQTKRDQRELQSAEFNALIYQINPHFIYNTLDNINILARLSNDRRMSTMITELSKLLRITLSGGKEVVSVQHELTHVGSYLRIMQLRSEDLFDYEIVCPQPLEEIQILKVILQPIAENAIQHGLEFTETGGFIRVSAGAQGAHLVLRVEDNGMGMDQYDANRLLDKLENNRFSEDEKRGIGLRNVWRRLKIFYGDGGFRLRFLPAELGGLAVEITLYNAVS